MTIRSNKITGSTPWSDGQILYAADLNDTFSRCVPMILTNNNVGSSFSVGSATTGAIVGSRTYSYAGSAQHWIKVWFNLGARANYLTDWTTGTVTPYGLIKVGSVVVETVSGVSATASLSGNYTRTYDQYGHQGGVFCSIITGSQLQALGSNIGSPFTITLAIAGSVNYTGTVYNDFWFIEAV